MVANWRLAVVFVAVVVGLAAGLVAGMEIMQLAEGYVPRERLYAAPGIIPIFVVLGCCAGGAFGLGYLAIKWENWSRKREKHKGSDRHKPATKRAKRRKERGR